MITFTYMRILLVLIIMCTLYTHSSSMCNVAEYIRHILYCLKAGRWPYKTRHKPNQIKCIAIKSDSSHVTLWPFFTSFSSFCHLLVVTLWFWPCFFFSLSFCSFFLLCVVCLSCWICVVYMRWLSFIWKFSLMQLRWKVFPVCFLPESLRGAQIADLKPNELDLCVELLADERHDAASTAHNFLMGGTF